MTNLERVIKTFNEGQKKYSVTSNSILYDMSEILYIVEIDGVYGNCKSISLTEFIFDYGLCEVLWGGEDIECINCRLEGLCDDNSLCDSESDYHKRELSTLPPSDRLKYIVDNSELSDV